MPRVFVRVSDVEKALWVASAWGERVSLSEWLRRAAADRLAVYDVAMMRTTTAPFLSGSGLGGAAGVSGVDGAGAMTPAVEPPAVPPSPGVGVRETAPPGDAVPRPAPPRGLGLRKDAKPDPKGKAAAEHGKGSRKAASGMCEHRVPAGSFCKQCEAER